MVKQCRTCHYGKGQADGEKLLCFLNPPTRIPPLDSAQKWERPAVEKEDMCSHWSVSPK